MRLPKRISPCPIVDSVIELRFDSTFPSDAIFGVFFASLRTEFSLFNRLPLAEIPEIVRDKDQNLKFSPCFESKSDQFVLRLGPKVIALSCLKQYAGWSVFFSRMRQILDMTRETGIVSNFLRLGIRYIDFFDDDIYNHVKLSLNLDGEPLGGSQKIVRVVTQSGKFTVNYQLINNALANINETQRIGSIIDTDVSFEPHGGFMSDGVDKLIDEAHVVSKETFFRLLKQEYIDFMNPEY